MRLLFCTANPRNDLNLTAELEAVLNRLDASVWHINYLHDVSTESLVESVRNFFPDIVHFCGHSDRDGLVFCNPTNGSPQSVGASTFSRMLLAAGPLKAVFLNSCKSLNIFNQLYRSAEWGIGTSREVGDADCIRFTESFYERLSTDEDDVLSAYRHALNTAKEPPATGGSPPRDLGPAIPSPSPMGALAAPQMFYLLHMEPTWLLLRRLKRLLLMASSGLFFSLVAGGSLGYHLVSRNQEARKAFEDLQAQQDHLNVQLAAIDKKFGDLPDVRSQILEANKTLLALNEQAKKLELANAWQNAIALHNVDRDADGKLPRPSVSDEIFKAIARGGPITYTMLAPPRWRETDQDDTRSWTREFNELRSAMERKDYALASLLARRLNAKRYPDLPENVFAPSRPGADSEGPFSIQE